MKPSIPLPDSTACPSRDQLRAFASAALTGDALDQMERHVEHCGTCWQTLEQWDEDSDALVQALARLPSGPDDEPAFQALEATLLARGAPIDLADCPTATFIGEVLGESDEVPDQIGGYQLLELIGQGATGAVFRARHIKLDRIVAIKVLNTRYVGNDPSAVSRFQHEMRAVGKLDHPSIVRATDAGEADGRHYLAMEYVDGIDASRLLRLTGPLRVADACEIVRQAATALQFAHEHGMVHRDVKPSNLLFAYDGRVKLLDLGLVRSDSPASKASDAWQSSVPHGTADYMPPEQWTHFASVDARADIYALGCTLYKLLTGAPVYRRPRHDYGAKMEAHISAPIPLIRHARPEVPLGLQKILCRMLSKRAADRYEAAAEVVEHLETYAQGARLAELGARVAAASPDDRRGAWSEPSTTIPERSGNSGWLTRRRWLAATAAAGLPVLGLLWGLRRAQQPTLQLGDWRSLRTTEPPESFPRAADDGLRSSRGVRTISQGAPLPIVAGADTLFHFGQPVRGCFAVRAEFTCEPGFDRIGLFFKYRPHRAEDAVVHPLQVIELAPSESGGYLLLWSRYCFSEQGDGTYQSEYTPWAETAVDFVPSSHRAQLEVTLGQVGFPEVAWNGARLAPSDWTVSWQARHMAQQTRDELPQAYLGRLGLFARSATASLSRIELRYVGKKEIL